MSDQLNPRFKKRMACDLRMGGQRYPGLVINLSRGGLFVQTTLAVQPGMLLDVNLNSPHSEEPIPLQARVVWKRVVNQRLRSVNQGGVGLEIQDATASYNGLLYDLEAAHMERSAQAFNAPSSSENSWTRALEAEAPGPGTSGPVARPPVRVDPNGDSGPLQVAQTQYSVRMRLEGSPRSRALTISAGSEEEAIDRVSKQCGAGWVVIELSEI